MATIKTGNKKKMGSGGSEDAKVMAISPEEAVKLLSKLSEPDKTDRKTQSFHLSDSTVELFKKNCGKASPARVLEEMLDQFNEAVASSVEKKQASDSESALDLEK